MPADPQVPGLADQELSDRMCENDQAPSLAKSSAAAGTNSQSQSVL
jgi:hypothetical protein